MALRSFWAGSQSRTVILACPKVREKSIDSSSIDSSFLDHPLESFESQHAQLQQQQRKIVREQLLARPNDPTSAF